MRTLLLGNCLETLKDVSDNSIDSVVTDPPYGLSFMGKKWDYDVPSIAIWKEVLRVLKPGGHLLSFGGTRTYHRLVVNTEDAGFEIRDQIQWIYGSGFPKSHNIKEGEFAGYGTALKPANEPIVVARKPLEKGLTVAQNVLKYGTGAINIDASRIGGQQGRWPANIMFDEEAAAMLDEQSGVLKSGKLSPNNNVKATTGWSGGSQADRVKSTFEPSSGGASRFFYCAKASKSERNASMVDATNNHPTVKPIKLMEYLITLATPPNGIVLDPFMGSGSTGVAATNLGFNFVGCEMDADYYQIAYARILNVQTAAPEQTELVIPL